MSIQLNDTVGSTDICGSTAMRPDAPLAQLEARQLAPEVFAPAERHLAVDAPLLPDGVDHMVVGGSCSPPPGSGSRRRAA